jgi:hypothetical protein
MEHIFVASKEDRVVERCGELACTATDVDRAVAALHSTVDDGPSPHIAIGECPLTCTIIDRELLARKHHGSTDLIRKELDIGDPALAARVIGGETRYLSEWSHRLGLLCCQFGFGTICHWNRSAAGSLG